LVTESPIKRQFGSVVDAGKGTPAAQHSPADEFDAAHPQLPMEFGGQEEWTQARQEVELE
jgi:hypothetical protein